MSMFYDLMNSVVRGTIYGACLVINGYGIFLLFRSYNKVVGNRRPGNQSGSAPPSLLKL